MGERAPPVAFELRNFELTVRSHGRPALCRLL